MQESKAQVNKVPENKVQDKKKMCFTPSHKSDINGLSKTMTNGFGAAARKNFGFGQHIGKNQNRRKVSNDSNDYDSEKEDDLFDLPSMEQKPMLNNTIKRASPLDDLRKSFDMRNSRSKIHSVNRSSFINSSEQPDNLLANNSAQFNDLKLTSLKERRSITRGLKITKINAPAQSNNLAKLASKPGDKNQKQKPKENPEIKIVEDKNKKVNALSKIIVDMLVNFDDNDLIQLE